MKIQVTWKLNKIHFAPDLRERELPPVLSVILKNNSVLKINAGTKFNTIHTAAFKHLV